MLVMARLTAEFLVSTKGEPTPALPVFALFVIFQQWYIKGVVGTGLE